MIHLPDRLSWLQPRETLARTQVLERGWPFFLDLCIAAVGLACFYSVIRIAMFWAGRPEPEIVISLSPRALPHYAFYSIVRIVALRICSACSSQSPMGILRRTTGVRKR